MRRAALALVVLLSCAMPSAGVRAADEPDHDNLGQALKKGKLALGFRYRFEDVADDAPAVSEKDAHASTLRTTLSYASGSFHRFGVFVEFEDVTDISLAGQHANAGAGSLSNGITDRPAIADPEITEVNQAYISHRGLPKTTIRAGRQVIKLADERFVGPVGWRQNHQTFDALSLTQESIPRTRLTYLFIANVNRIFGDNKGMRSHFLDAEISLGKAGHLAPFLYALDYEETADAPLSTTTFGARWADARECGHGWSVPYRVEIARQSDAGDNPRNVDAGYLRLEVGGKRADWTVKAGYELLEGDTSDGAFATPLATLHGFNGWADKFLTTPATGLADLYAAATWKRNSLAATLVLHDFSSDSESLDYGSEIDAQVTYTASWSQVFAATAARYDADEFAADTLKLWVWTAYSF